MHDVTTEALAEVRALVRESVLSPGVRVEVGLSTAFGCTLQGSVPEDDVIWLAGLCAEAGADEVGLSDTTGMANPAQVRRLFTRLRAELGDRAGAHNRRPQRRVDHTTGRRQGVAGRELLDRGRGAITEDAVDRSRREAGAAQLGLQAGDVVALHAGAERAAEDRRGLAGLVEADVVGAICHARSVARMDLADARVIDRGAPRLFRVG